MTKYEQAIYHLVTRSADHLTADQVFSALKADHPTLSLATVYNNLNKLWSAGMIRKISIEGSPDHYDRTEKPDHLVCSCCGKLADICFTDLSASLQRQLGDSFQYYDLKVYYLCPACRKKQVHFPPQ